jgi:hypothetical protein
MVAWKNGKKGGIERRDLNGKMARLEDDSDGRRTDGRETEKLKCKQFLGRNSKISYT